MTSEQKVKEVYPGAQAFWTSRGWRVMHPGTIEVLGRTESFLATESEVWADAWRKIEASRKQEGAA